MAQFGKPKGGGGKDSGFLTAIPPDARKRLKAHQDAIRASTKGMWRPVPSLHEFGETFFSRLVGIVGRVLVNKKTNATSYGYTLVFEYEADGDDPRSAKAHGKQWRGRTYSDRVWKDKDTGEEKVIDFATLKAYASMITGEEVEDGEDAINALISAAKEKPLVQLRIRERKNNSGGDPFIEEDILAFSTGDEDSGEDADETGDELEDHEIEADADGEEEGGDEDSDEEDTAPPPPRKMKK